MTLPAPRMAVGWVTANPYLAVSEDHQETVTLSQHSFDRCIGSSKYKICTFKVTLNAFNIRIYSLEQGLNSLGSTTEGCSICLLTVECGYQVIVCDIKLRSDLELCEKLTPKVCRRQAARSNGTPNELCTRVG